MNRLHERDVLAAVEVWYYIVNGCSWSDRLTMWSPIYYGLLMGARSLTGVDWRFGRSTLLPPTRRQALALLANELRLHGFRANVRTGSLTYEGAQ
jgi:hypothetical protein